jgi:hypothetical protein
MAKLEDLLMRRQSYKRLLKTEEATCFSNRKHKKRIIALRREINIIDQEIVRKLDESG